MKSNRVITCIFSLLFLAGCATSNTYRNIPVEDRSSTATGAAGTRTAPNQNRIQTPQNNPSAVVVTPTDPSMSVRSVTPRPVIREQRQDLPSETDVWGEATEVTQEPTNPAVVALLDTANQDRRQGDLRGAQTRLERAQRIAPNDPEVYFQLADVKRQLGQFLDAEQVALRGIDVSSNQPSKLRRFWALISQIRSDGGDLAGAEEARNQAETY